MSSVIRVTLLSVFICFGLSAHSLAGDDHRHGGHGHGHHKKQHHRHPGHHHVVEHRYIERRYVEPQYYHVIERPYRPRHVHYHDQHCGHYVSSRERVVYRSSYPTETIRYNDDFGIDSLTIRWR